MKLLFIHGAGGTKSKWRGLELYLEGMDYEVLDLPGHGDSTETLCTSIGDYATYIGGLIKEDTIVIGHSMGGLIAVELASQNKKVKGIVLAASFYELPVHQKLFDKLANGEFPDSLFYASYSKETDEELLSVEKQESAFVPVNVSYTDFKATNEYGDGKEKLSLLNIPVCAILGEQDRLLPPNAENKFKEVKPDIKLTTINGAGHYIMLEKPMEFYYELVKFVRIVQG